MAVSSTSWRRLNSPNVIERHVETGAANTTLTATVPAGLARRIVSVLVAYSATPTQAGVTTALDNGAGAGYDNTLDTGSANARYTKFLPSADLFIGDDDALVITAPGGGAGITASVAVYLETA